LRDMGKKLGLLDVDLSGSSLYKALGLQSPPRFRTSTVRRKLIPPQVMGMRLFSICAHFGEGNAVMWKAETSIVEIPDEVRKGLRKQTYVSNRAEVIRQMLSTQVEWPENTEMLLADMPPSTASEVFSFFDNVSGLLGVLIVSQPSDISALGMTRTIDFLRHEGIPIMGLVSMMDGHLCPSCGLVTHQLLSPKLAMEKVAKDCGGIETLLR